VIATTDRSSVSSSKPGSSGTDGPVVLLSSRAVRLSPRHFLQRARNERKTSLIETRR
jgi:hypothetical protein